MSMIFSNTIIEYTRKNPFPARIKDRFILNKKGSTKQTYHITLNLKGSGITYEPGDSIGILPENPPHLVSEILKYVASPDPEFFTKKANLSKITSALLAFLAEWTPSKKHLLQDPNCDIPLLFKLICPKKIPHDLLAPLLLPLMPRFYSVASSMRHVGEEVHLVVSTFSYLLQNELRSGVASEFLTKTDQPIPLFVQKTPHFKLPSSDRPIIMIGAGTGIAPYRAFMQERSAGSQNWLFFGERNRAFDFYYEEEWQKLISQGQFKMALAFSRDQKEKLYVQHKLLKHSQELRNWINDGAFIYICGDAKHMAKDVTQALETILQSRDSIKSLRKEKRLLLDVY